MDLWQRTRDATQFKRTFEHYIERRVHLPHANGVRHTNGNAINIKGSRLKGTQYGVAVARGVCGHKYQMVMF